MKSFSLVPHGDNSLLLINSGISTVKAIFYRTGNTAKAQSDNLSEMYRTGDIENVGKTARHGTF